MILINNVVTLYFDITYGPTLCFFQAPSPSDMLPIPIQSSMDDCSDGTPGKGNNSRWSTLSWDIPVDLLSPPTPDPSSTFHLDSDSRPSSGTFTWKGHKPWKTRVTLNINYRPFCNLCILARCDLDSFVFCISSFTFLQTCHCQTFIHAYCYCCLCLQALTFLFLIIQSKCGKYKNYLAVTCYKQHMKYFCFIYN